jgi:hypothetical protein
MRMTVARLVWLIVIAGTGAGAGSQGGTELVKVTPLGSHAGEFCRDDRGFLFEDPTGVRILYDPGRPVDENDARLGDVHVMLLSHAHTDHLGDTRPLVILNMGDVFGIGADEAAFTLRFLVRPRTVMPSHSNEQSSSGGLLARGSKVDRLASQAAGVVDIVLPLSGVTRSFDGEGRCVGCQ